MAKLLQKINITEREVLVNSTQFFEFSEGEKLSGNLKELYKKLDIDYPKYYKMDRLSKLAFLSVELLLMDIDLSKYDVTNRAIILGNQCGSLESDLVHNKNTFGEKFQPSPAVFVYTLPNIMIGEVAIRHDFKGENAYINIDKDFWKESSSLANLTLETTDTELLVLGQVELYKEKCIASLILIENTEGQSIKDIIQEVI